jgi:hypothetical protein
MSSRWSSGTASANSQGWPERMRVSAVAVTRGRNQGVGAAYSLRQSRRRKTTLLAAYRKPAQLRF